MRSSGIFSRVSVAAISACMLAMLAAPAAAQTPTPVATPPSGRTPPDNRIPVVAFDLRGMFASLGQDTLTAANLFVSPLIMSSKALGLSAGAHVYPLRAQSFALGLGGEAMLARNSFEPINATTLKPTGTVYNRKVSGISGQVSLNFGHRMGWSYLTGGVGPMTFESNLATLTPDGLSDMTINYGGGARWFNYDHLAFTVDIRFYRTGEAVATLNTAGRLPHTVFIMSAGISVK